jgi:hypothetical protein
MVNMAMVAQFSKFEKKATRQQSTVIKIYRLLAIVVLLRLAPQDCWLVVALGQTECCHGRSDVQQFCFCWSMHDTRARKRFLIDLLAIFWRKGATTVDLENYWGVAFLHDYIKLEGRSWCSINTLSSISPVY